jgi:hypothetical protein
MKLLSVLGGLTLCVMVVGCGMPIRVGIQEARAQAGESTRSHSRHANPAPGGAVVVAPRVPQPEAPADLVGLKLEGGTPGVHLVTFGQVFAPGQLPRGSGVAARAGSREVPVQVDVKTTNPDGSARMGIVTLQAATPAEIMLMRQPAEAAPPVNLSGLAGRYDLAVEMTIHEEGGDRTFRADAGALLVEALASGKASFWMRGPLATEARVETPVTGSMRLVFDIRAYADGSTFTDVQFNNDVALQKAGGKLVYDVAITLGGQPVFQKAGIRHFQYQTWHKEVWSGGAPGVNVIHDSAALVRARAIHNYDWGNGVSERTLARLREQMAGPGFFDVLGDAGVTRYMPMAGGRGDIGPTTMVNTVWVMTQSADAARIALAQSDAAGSVPWHLFDRETGTYISVEKYPTFWADGRGKLTLTQPIDAKGSQWWPDQAHQPDLSYIPYLLTGSRYRLNQLEAQVSFAVADTWPAPRQNEKGLVATAESQVRAGAWSLRGIVECAFIEPDGFPLKPYFERLLRNNVAWLRREAAEVHQGEVWGWQPVPKRPFARTATWQIDFLASSLLLAARQGVPGTHELLLWQSNFLAGRFLSGDKGFSPYGGAAYYLVVTGADGQPVQTWAELSKVTREKGVPGSLPERDGEWPKSSFASYLVAAKAVLGELSSLTGSEEARRALQWVQEHAPQAGSRELQGDPTWSIVTDR